MTSRMLKKAFAVKKSCNIYRTHITDPFKNLSFEDWMHSKVSFEKHHCLYLWQNQPTIVIGKHQNPWKECNVNKLISNNINLCRRSSGGGTVYHDLGNLNLTFFTDRQSYDRKFNLGIIVKALKKRWPELDIEVNKRDDIILNKKHKISGSSAKLGRTSAYHHCTLLINSKKRDIFEYLNKDDSELICNATDSVLSPVANLSDIIKDISVQEVVNCISAEYGDMHSDFNKYDIDTGDEVTLDGVSELEKSNRKWKWTFGKTPTFKYQLQLNHEDIGDIAIKFSIKNGKISDIILDCSKSTLEDLSFLDVLKECLIGCELVSKNISSVLNESKIVRRDEIASFIGNELIKKIS